MPTMDVNSRIAALTRCLDLHGLDDHALAVLADRVEVIEFAVDEVVCEETGEEEAEQGRAGSEGRHGLYCIAEGLIAVTQRSLDRRAPTRYLLGPGALFGETMLNGGAPVGAEARRRSVLLHLSPALVRWAKGELRRFAKVMDRLAYIQRKSGFIIDSLRRSVLFRHVPPRQLYELLEGADVDSYAAAETVIDAGHVSDGLVVVMRGEVLLVDRSSGDTIRLLDRGSVLGEIEFMASRPHAYDVVAGEQPVELVHLHADRIYDLLGRSSSFRRAVLACSFGQVEQRRHLVEHVFSREQRAINLIAVVGDQPTLPLATLSRFLAEASAREFGDKIVIVRFDPRAPAVPRTDLQAFAGGGELVWVTARPDNTELLRPETALRASLDAHYVIWDLTGVALRDLPPAVRLAERAVVVASGALEELPDDLLERLPASVLFTSVVPIPQRPTRARRVGPASARISGALLEAARRGGTLDDLDPPLREQVMRWARAMTDRRVGLALGGGGAFGYAHLPLIERIHAERVPIDLVSGCSIGSVVGAYYASRGLDGIRQFVAEAGDFGSGLFPRVTVNSAVVESFINKKLDRIRLEDMLVPFYPVAVDIDAACQVALRWGPIGFGVRASCAFPGLFTPVTYEVDAPGKPRRIVRLVDGAVINLVPDDTLYLEGAQIVIASNVIPPPQQRALQSSKLVLKMARQFGRLPGVLGRRIREFEPLVRFDDCLRTMYIMMHSPVDWDSRTAEAKFRARPGRFSPMHWGEGSGIAGAQDPERIERAVEQLKVARRALRWRRPGQHAAPSPLDVALPLEEDRDGVGLVMAGE